MKEIKVKLYSSENDDYVELWEVINKEPNTPKYFGRYTYRNAGIWYTICDPLGYCELNSRVKEDIMFILCDENGNEYCRYSNGQENPLPTFETVIKNEWVKVSDTIAHNTENAEANFWAEAIDGETTMELNKWLLTYMDPVLYKKEIDEMYGITDNWVYCRTEETGYEIIPDTVFSYLGKEFQFAKIKYRHKVCGAEWIEFCCVDAPEVQKSDWGNNCISSYMTLGNWFDANATGAMTDRRSARKLVLKALEEIYPMQNKYDRLLYVNTNGYTSARSKTYLEAAEALLDISRDLHKDKVLELIENEKKAHTFILNTKENRDHLRAKYGMEALL